MIDDVQRTTSDLRLKSLHRRGAVYFDMQKFKEANEDLHLVCLQDPTSIAPYVLHGKVLKAAGNLVEAEDSLDHAILVEPQMYELYVERGDIRMRSGNSNKKIEALTGTKSTNILLLCIG